jgi:hypothetical protein
MSTRGSKIRRLFSYVLAASVLVAFGSLGRTQVQAAAISSFSDRLSTIKESVAANHTVTFTINDAIDATDTFTIDFPNTFNTSGFLNSDDNDFDITDDGGEIIVVASGSCAANRFEITTANTSTDTFTFTLCSGSTAIATSSVIVVEIGTHATDSGTGDTQITSQTATENNSDAIVTIGGTFGGSGTLALEIVADNDVTVNATVDPSITCSFTGMTTTFASLTTGAISTSDTNTAITLSTNAGSGLTVWVYDAGNGTNPGLYKSTGTTYLIGSSDGGYSNIATLAAGTDGYGLTAAASGGSGATLTVDGRFDASGGANEVGGLEVGAGLAVPIAAATGSVASRVLTITHKAAVSGLVPAGSYTDTITYVCSGIF